MLWLHFYFVDSVFQCTHFKNFHEVPFVYFIFLLLPVHLVSNPRSCCQIHCWNVCLLFFSKSFIFLGFTFRSLICFELSFVCMWCEVRVQLHPFISCSCFIILKRTSSLMVNRRGERGCPYLFLTSGRSMWFFIIRYIVSFIYYMYFVDGFIRFMKFPPQLLSATGVLWAL